MFSYPLPWRQGPSGRGSAENDGDFSLGERCCAHELKYSHAYTCPYFFSTCASVAPALRSRRILVSLAVRFSASIRTAGAIFAGMTIAPSTSLEHRNRRVHARAARRPGGIHRLLPGRRDLPAAYRLHRCAWRAYREFLFGDPADVADAAVDQASAQPGASCQRDQFAEVTDSLAVARPYAEFARADTVQRLHLVSGSPALACGIICPRMV